GPPPRAAAAGPSSGPSAAGGALSKLFVDDAITDALRPAGERRRIDALVTGPISKESWAMAGQRWPGHTELLGARAKAKRQVMLFWSSRLRVALATGHVPLAGVLDQLTIGKVFDPIDLGNEFCRRLGIRAPRIAVCGVNPHAGEHGLFGDDERRVIAPAIELARRAGIDAHGPFPADTIFISAAAGSWDLVVAMYHDQGLIPVKLLARDEAVNVTTGLPFVRTSPDHGTAFDIAGRSVANPGSMKAAILLAAKLATHANGHASSPRDSESTGSAAADSDRPAAP
ncbi:MAG: 4-hydroxythreonine-4-phosphate dehydrogenase PdxA, partial [Phycisphaerae bacterium]|nr:4-hydroxythreonine-4-phosphate dehydrogenase PdxA [Phycisphaerae bacterium]